MKLSLKILLSESPDHVRFMNRDYGIKTGMPIFYSIKDKLFVMDLEPGYHDESEELKRFQHKHKDTHFLRARFWYGPKNVLAFWYQPSEPILKFVLDGIKKQITSPIGEIYIETQLGAPVGKDIMGTKDYINVKDFKIKNGVVSYDKKDIVDTYNGLL